MGNLRYYMIENLTEEKVDITEKTFQIQEILTYKRIQGTLKVLD